MSLVLLDRQETKEDFHLQVSLRRSSFGCEAVSNQNTQQALALPEKEVIQPHLPVRLPCYDLILIAGVTFCLYNRHSGTPNFTNLTGGVYKT